MFNLCEHSLSRGIAWQVQFSSYGINAAKYAAELCLGVFFLFGRWWVWVFVEVKLQDGGVHKWGYP